MNAGISILDKSVILGLPICVLAGYSVLAYANDSLAHWLPDRIKTIIQSFGKLFRDWVCEVLLKLYKKYTRFYRFFLFTPALIESSQF